VESDSFARSRAHGSRSSPFTCSISKGTRKRREEDSGRIYSGARRYTASDRTGISGTPGVRASQLFRRVQ